MLKTPFFRFHFTLKYLLLIAFISKNLQASCVAPVVDKCVEVQIIKRIGTFKKYPQSKKSCKIEGRTENAEARTLFIEDTTCQDLTPSSKLLGDLIHYFGCPDGGVGLQKDPTIPGLILKTPKECKKH